jgi:hypothetical protein
MHGEEYRELLRKAAGRPLVLAVSAGGTVGAAEPAQPGEPEIQRQKLREEAQREPAVQDALDLFDGKVVDVREAKTSREEP